MKISRENIEFLGVGFFTILATTMILLYPQYFIIGMICGAIGTALIIDIVENRH